MLLLSRKFYANELSSRKCEEKLNLKETGFELFRNGK
jgi:hypothetical protein